MKPKYVVIENSTDSRNIILITQSEKKADKVANTLQELNNPECDSILYEVETYFGFKGIDYWNYNRGEN